MTTNTSFINMHFEAQPSWERGRGGEGGRRKEREGGRRKERQRVREPRKLFLLLQVNKQLHFVTIMLMMLKLSTITCTKVDKQRKHK